MRAASDPYGDVSTLEHEAGDHSVEDRVLVAEIHTRHALSLLARAEASEVLGSLGNNIVEELFVKRRMHTSPQTQFCQRAVHRW